MTYGPDSGAASGWSAYGVPSRRGWRWRWVAYGSRGSEFGHAPDKETAQRSAQDAMRRLNRRPEGPDTSQDTAA